MSDILIKNLELPKEIKDSYCLFVTPYNVAEFNDRGLDPDKPRHDVIVLPDHGEAKDTDIAIRYIKDEMEDDFNKTTTLDEKSYKEGMKRAIELIGYAPTVLEASE